MDEKINVKSFVKKFISDMRRMDNQEVLKCFKIWAGMATAYDREVFADLLFNSREFVMYLRTCDFCRFLIINDFLEREIVK